ncbi:helix-turn-helix domain-containing protein [Gordonibacter massiliensis (ex Traore et al. 2017)]|uniref:Helix-turn-helix domain-containing protein n=1 Tax=Gordonibacter massiliensis (ex Traore et al. 2017) TaxID=1841863 RepID=A0A842JEM9_9ACTN|nr:helix-turn-helix domain-containing protein [Gordonibacter massiliensis (ex Traore et al. 2017)]MBC2890137.1 helix-turn-helix domain-containing protein [Gordonibacter massiliensis (ex Traore et al. 2017)]
MDTKRTGALIRSLREERGLTQLQLAARVGVGDKAVSKWERGGGCPDVSLLPALADELGTTVETLLAGALAPDERQGGTMKRTAFRVCPACGNVITTTGDAEVSCCGRKLDPLEARPADEAHALRVESVEGDWYVTFDHPMEKGHHLGFVAVVGYDRLAVEKLYPEQGGEARLPRLAGGALYAYCTEHGLTKHPVPGR